MVRSWVIAESIRVQVEKAKIQRDSFDVNFHFDCEWPTNTSDWHFGLEQVTVIHVDPERCVQVPLLTVGATLRRLARRPCVYDLITLTIYSTRTKTRSYRVSGNSPSSVPCTMIDIVSPLFASAGIFTVAL